MSPPSEYQLGQDLADNRAKVVALSDRVDDLERELEILTGRIEPVLPFIADLMKEAEATKDEDHDVHRAKDIAHATRINNIASSIAGGVIVGAILIGVRILIGLGS